MFRSYRHQETRLETARQKIESGLAVIFFVCVNALLIAGVADMVTNYGTDHQLTSSAAPVTRVAGATA